MGRGQRPAPGPGWPGPPSKRPWRCCSWRQAEPGLGMLRLQGQQAFEGRLRVAVAAQPLQRMAAAEPGRRRWRDRPPAPGRRSQRFGIAAQFGQRHARGGTRRPDAAARRRARASSSASASAARPRRSQVAARFTRVERGPAAAAARRRNSARQRAAAGPRNAPRLRGRGCGPVRNRPAMGSPLGRTAPAWVELARIVAIRVTGLTARGPVRCTHPLNRVVVPHREACETSARCIRGSTMHSQDRDDDTERTQGQVRPTERRDRLAGGRRRPSTRPGCCA